MMPEKSPVRVEIERQVAAALDAAGRPMTARELLPIVDAAEDAKALVRILSHMRSAGDIAHGPEVSPGEPGGMDGRGARPVASYCLPILPYDHNRQATESMNKPTDTDLVAALKMHAAEDDGEACLDSIGESHNGDEFVMPPLSGHGELQDCEDYTFEHDLITTRQIADDSLIDIANALLAGNATWAAAKRMHAAVTTFASDYV